jgi:hypothetical protein
MQTYFWSKTFYIFLSSSPPPLFFKNTITLIYIERGRGEEEEIKVRPSWSLFFEMQSDAEKTMGGVKTPSKKHYKNK